MTKTDMLALLEHIPDDADIRIAIPTHDRWCTQLAVDVANITEKTVKSNAYHYDRDTVCDEWDDEGKHVWVISGLPLYRIECGT